MKEILTLMVKLLLITAIVAALLGGINMVTAPIIAENNAATFEANLKELLPDAETFEEVESIAIETQTGVTVNSFYEGSAADGPVGYVIEAVCSEGYGGDVVVMTGVNLDGTVNKVKVTEMEETPGLGAKCQTEWIDQYIGLKGDIAVNKNGSAGSNTNKIDAISGATITSNAVTKAVNDSLAAANVVLDGVGAVEESIEEAVEEAVEEAIAEEAAEAPAAEEGGAENE